ncbi:unnamed protein product [Ectocarpus sp. 12 AP-2014]
MPVAQARSDISLSIEPPTQRQLTWWFDGLTDDIRTAAHLQVGSIGRKYLHMNSGEPEARPRIPWHGRKVLAVDPVGHGKYGARCHIVVYRQHEHRRIHQLGYRQRNRVRVARCGTSCRPGHPTTGITIAGNIIVYL